MDLEKIKHSHLLIRGLNLHIAQIGTGQLLPSLPYSTNGFTIFSKTSIFSGRRIRDGNLPSRLSRDMVHMEASDARPRRRRIPGHRPRFQRLRPLRPTVRTRESLIRRSLVDDLIGILDAIGVPKVFLVGKDFGAFPAYDFAVKHPDRVHGVVNLGIPYSPVGLNLEPLPEGFYIHRWREPGRAEADFGRISAKQVVRNVYILFSKSELPIAAEGEEIMDLVDPSDSLPPWLTEEDLDVYGKLYEKSGFRFPLQIPYRKLMEWLPAVDPVIRRPTLLIMGEKDYVIKFPGMEEYARSDLMKSFVTDLEIKFLPEGSHFVHEQHPDEVNELILGFLKRHV